MAKNSRIFGEFCINDKISIFATAKKDPKTHENNRRL